MSTDRYRYLPDTAEDVADMLAAIGVESVEALFADIPGNIRFTGDLPLREGLSELELLRRLRALAEKNQTSDRLPLFLGAGTYDHFIPSVVDAVISRSEFATAYTPYQAEASQGELQAIFEFQSMMCELTGMDVSNSSLYDGFASLAEGIALAAAVKKRTEVILSQAVHPNGRAVVRTAARGRNLTVLEAPLREDSTDLTLLKTLLSDRTAAVVIQYPNFFGSIEDLRAIKELAEAAGAYFIVMANPLALAVLEAPGNLGADVVVGDTQPFGLPMSFGGPHCGYFCVKQQDVRKVPGRLVGETVDQEGRRGYVLTLQSREQHIRREKATSYMSSNQALNALASAVCLSALGKQGVQEMARQNVAKTHYFAEKAQERGFTVFNQQPFFNEVVLELPLPAARMNQKLLEAGYIGGYSLEKEYGWADRMLICVTEKRTRAEIEGLIDLLEGCCDE